MVSEYNAPLNVWVILDVTTTQIKLSQCEPSANCNFSGFLGELRSRMKKADRMV